MRALIDYLPPHIRRDEEMRRIQEALTLVMEGEWEANDDLKAQIFPQTATWTLPYWERRFGIEGDETLDEDGRRAALLAKIRSSRTATVEAVRALVAAFTDGGVTVTEFPAEYRFRVTIQQLSMSAELLDTLKAALSEFVPAHLGFDIELVVTGGDAAEYVCAAVTGWSITDSAATARI